MVVRESEQEYMVAFLHTDFLIISKVANMKDTFKTMKSQLSELKEIFETIQPITEPPEKVRHTHPVIIVNE